MRNILYYFLAVVLIFASCKKEDSVDTTSPGSSQSRLVKWVLTMGSDSLATTYTYNTAGKVTLFDFSGAGSGQAFSNKVRVTRSSQGIIQRYSYLDPEFQQYGIDSIVYNVAYNTTTSQYAGVGAKITVQSSTIRDSTAFAYNANGKIASARSFFDDGTGTGYEELQKNEYTYTGNNLTTVKTYSFENGSYILEQTVTYEYDAKDNPLVLGVDAIVLTVLGQPVTNPFQFSQNNVAKTTTTGTGTAEVITATYTYNDKNKPTGATLTVQPGSGTATYKYYYQ